MKKYTIRVRVVEFKLQSPHKSEDKKFPFSPQQCFDILKKIRKEDYEILGFK